jgi:hypothetical protein
MTATAAGRAATLRERGVGRWVYQADEFPRLIDDTLAEDDDEVGAQRVVYAEDVTVPPPRGRVGRSVLVVTVNRGWGAAYYRGPDLYAWITHNPRPAPDASELLFDPEAGTNYPAGAAIPVNQLRTAIEEYLQTGERPTCVQWQEPDRVMIY